MRCCKCDKHRVTNKGKNTVKVICWEDYQMCARCCIKYHPERYPLNVINKFLGKTLSRKEIDRRHYMKKKALIQT